MEVRRVGLLVALLSMSLACGESAAAPPAAHAAAVNTVSMDQAVKMAERRYHARVVKAQAQRDGGHTTYVLRLLSDSGKVWTVRIDAASGSIQ